MKIQSSCYMLKLKQLYCLIQIVLFHLHTAAYWSRWSVWFHKTKTLLQALLLQLLKILMTILRAQQKKNNTKYCFIILKIRCICLMPKCVSAKLKALYMLNLKKINQVISNVFCQSTAMTMLTFEPVPLCYSTGTSQNLSGLLKHSQINNVCSVKR